jgi:hypothetical protein
MFVVASVALSLLSVQQIQAEMTLNRPCCELKMLPMPPFMFIQSHCEVISQILAHTVQF